MMKEFGFVYDSSIPAPLSDPPIWPYTLDFKIPHKCIGRRKCPSRSFPGLWVSKIYFCAEVLQSGKQLCQLPLPPKNWLGTGGFAEYPTSRVVKLYLVGSYYSKK
jgi:hypothetical protein